MSGPPAATPNPYSDDDRQRWRKAILAKGKEVSDKLVEIKAGKEVSLEDLSLWANGEPAETKEKRLRRFFDHLMARLRVVDDPAFGWDSERGQWWSVAELNEAPWAEVAP